MSHNLFHSLLSMFVTFFLVITFGLSLTTTFAQVQLFKADIVKVNGKNISSREVEIVLGMDAIELLKPKGKSIVRTIPYSSVLNAEYSYSNRPTIAEGTGAIALLGVTGFPLFFNSKKRNWLAVNAGENSVLLDLRSSNYRTLLLQLQQKNVSVTDIGDKDKKKKPNEIKETKENK